MAYLQVSDVKVDCIADAGASDVYVASREWVRRPVRHGDILAIVRQHGVVAEVREIHGDNHQRPVRSVLEIAVPGSFEVWAQASDLLFSWSELAR